MNMPSLSPGLAQAGTSLLRGGVGRGGSTGYMMSSLMGGVLQSLSAEQQKQRQQALQDAARAPVGRTVAWQSAAPQTADRPGRTQPTRQQTRATYVNKGK